MADQALPSPASGPRLLRRSAHRHLRPPRRSLLLPQRRRHLGLERQSRLPGRLGHRVRDHRRRDHHEGLARSPLPVHPRPPLGEGRRARDRLADRARHDLRAVGACAPERAAGPLRRQPARPGPSDAVRRPDAPGGARHLLRVAGRPSALADRPARPDRGGRAGPGRAGDAGAGRLAAHAGLAGARHLADRRGRRGAASGLASPPTSARPSRRPPTSAPSTHPGRSRTSPPRAAASTGVAPAATVSCSGTGRSTPRCSQTAATASRSPPATPAAMSAAAR